SWPRRNSEHDGALAADARAVCDGSGHASCRVDAGGRVGGRARSRWWTRWRWHAALRGVYGEADCEWKGLFANVHSETLDLTAGDSAVMPGWFRSSQHRPGIRKPISGGQSQCEDVD